MSNQALIDLRDKVKAGEFTRWTVKWTPLTAPQKWLVTRAYDGSLDAAKALHEAVLGDGYIGEGYKYCIWGNGSVSVFNVITDNRGRGEVTASGHSNTPARAWLIAILNALIAKEDGNQ